MATLAPEPLLRLRDITQAYRKGGSSDLLVLDGINMNLWENQIVGLLGRSGCGKSTILRIVAGLIPPTSGNVQFRDKTVSGPVPGVAMVFQTFALFPWLTVLENVEAVLKARGMEPEERRRRSLKMLDSIWDRILRISRSPSLSLLPRSITKSRTLSSSISRR